MMDKTTVLDRLAHDKPLFHYLDDDGVRRVALAGITASPGNTSWAVGSGILRWIADHLSGEMITVETGAGNATVLFAALAKHHYCCTVSQREVVTPGAYLEQIGVPNDKLTFLVGTTDETLSRFGSKTLFDFAYIDGCHGYPFPALDWHYIDKHLNVGGILGMDDAQLRPVREHCEFLEENGTYRLAKHRQFRPVLHEADRPKPQWIDQAYSRAKKDPLTGGC